MSNNKDVLRVAVIALIVCLSITIILVISLNQLNKKLNKTPNVTGSEYYGESEDTLEGYYPRGLVSLTQKYHGELDNSEIQEVTSDFIRTVFEINDKKDDPNYYKENENKLIEFGITSEAQFQEIKNKIMALEKEELEYKLSKFDTDTISEEDNYLKVDLIIELKDGKKLVFNEKIQEEFDASKLTFIFN